MNTSSFPASARAWMGAHLKSAQLLWLYGLTLAPTLTDLIESGHLPLVPREWITEIVIGSLIALLVRRVRRDHFAVLALTRRDALTGLWNRRAFDEAVTDECVRQQRNQRPLTLVYLDLDHFKQINDQLGHHIGDQVLQQFARALLAVIRAHIDRAFRLGGDEFALLLPGSSAADARTLVERVRSHCASQYPLWSAGLLGISAGQVEHAPGESVSALVQRADQAMYQAKQQRQSRCSTQPG